MKVIAGCCEACDNCGAAAPDDAETVRSEFIDAIYEIDGDCNSRADEQTGDCGWHINIDAGDGHRLDPDRFIVGVDELLLLARNT